MIDKVSLSPPLVYIRSGYCGSALLFYVYLFIYKYTGATCPVSAAWKREGSERRVAIETFFLLSSLFLSLSRIVLLYIVAKYAKSEVRFRPVRCITCARRKLLICILDKEA